MHNSYLLLLLFLLFFGSIQPTPIEKYVFDSTQLQGELNWDKEAFGDSSDLPAGWKEQSFSPRNGDIWRIHFVCDISSSNPNNWLRLPFIRRDEANRLVIKLEYTIRECKKYPGEIRSCKETFQMLYAESDGMASTNFSESSYKYLKTIAPNSDVQNGASPQSLASSTTSSTTSSTSSPIFKTEVDLALRSNKKGVYLVFRDQGACVSLLSIRVYYTLCSAQINNLVVYPKTPTGSNLTDLIQRSGSCVQNAETKQTPFAYCQTNGNWFFVNSDETIGANMCFCKPGYYYYAPNAQCLACPQGKYKSEMSNKGECTLCPEFSYSISAASLSCKCLDGYYRLDVNDLTSPCLPYPPEPKNLTVYYLDQTTIKLRWNALTNYDPTLIKYKLECFKCIGGNSNAQNDTKSKSVCTEKTQCEPYIQITPDKSEIFDNKVTLTSLDSNTHYFIELYAQHVHNLFKTKTVDILIQTNEPTTSIDNYIRNISAYQFSDMNQIILLWSLHEENEQIDEILLNDQILNYEIRYWPLGYFNKAHILNIQSPANNFTLRNANPNILSSNLYIFQLRLQTLKYGWTDYTPPIESLKITSNTFYYSLVSKSNSVSPSSVVSPSTLSTREYLYNQFLISSKPNVQQNSSNLTFYIIISILTALTMVILILSLLTLLSRSGKLKFFTKFLVKDRSSQIMLPSPNIKTDTISYGNKEQYNQLGICSGTTSTTSGGSSPVWPKTYIDPHTYEDPTKIVSLFARELAPSNIIIESVIGGGEFGDVCKGRLKMSSHIEWATSKSSDECIVAIKTLKGAATEQNRCDFLTEASIMAQFNDQNVIRLEGVVTQSNPLMIVTEFMENGSLDSYLRLNEPKLKLTQLVKMLKDVASGMRYLSEMNYIHRDLAARNILINKDLVCKVADFGLSREIDMDSFEYTTKGGKITIRWTAPEACNFRKYSCASDVWSFGVLVWEVLSFGERPYWNWENKDVVRAVQEMYRLPPPPNCPDTIYKLMLHCWQDDRSKRPKFNDIVFMLDELLTKYSDELKKPTKFKELLPINPRQPTKVQLTRTRQFLTGIKMEKYADSFEIANLGNMSNLFQLDAHDLFYLVGIHLQFEQKKVLDELKKIYDGYMNHFSSTLRSSHHGNHYNQNSYITTSNQIQQQQQQMLSLMRNNSMTMSKNANDLLTFSVASNLHNGGGNTMPPPLGKNGYLV